MVNMFDWDKKLSEVRDLKKPKSYSMVHSSNAMSMSTAKLDRLFTATLVASSGLVSLPSSERRHV